MRACLDVLRYRRERPLGASFGDFLSQPTQYGGLGLGAIIAIVVWISLTRRGEDQVAVS